ncbi:hypothetical protein HDU98_011753 [Podochytrium sp. JEL0797]|nr:hypothetical protein HDU98_011753 [Podochytrium sp. JEL0797]
MASNDRLATPGAALANVETDPHKIFDSHPSSRNFPSPTTQLPSPIPTPQSQETILLHQRIAILESQLKQATEALNKRPESSLPSSIHKTPTPSTKPKSIPAVGPSPTSPTADPSSTLYTPSNFWINVVRQRYPDFQKIPKRVRVHALKFAATHGIEEQATGKKRFLFIPAVLHASFLEHMEGKVGDVVEGRVGGVRGRDGNGQERESEEEEESEEGYIVVADDSDEGEEEDRDEKLPKPLQQQQPSGPPPLVGTSDNQLEPPQTPTPSTKPKSIPSSSSTSPTANPPSPFTLYIPSNSWINVVRNRYPDIRRPTNTLKRLRLHALRFAATHGIQEQKTATKRFLFVPVELHAAFLEHMEGKVGDVGGGKGVNERESEEVEEEEGGTVSLPSGKRKRVVANDSEEDGEKMPQTPHHQPGGVPPLVGGPSVSDESWSDLIRGHLDPTFRANAFDRRYWRIQKMAFGFREVHRLTGRKGSAFTVPVEMRDGFVEFMRDAVTGGQEVTGTGDVGVGQAGGLVVGSGQAGNENASVREAESFPSHAGNEEARVREVESVPVQVGDEDARVREAEWAPAQAGNEDFREAESAPAQVEKADATIQEVTTTRFVPSRSVIEKMMPSFPNLDPDFQIAIDAGVRDLLEEQLGEGFEACWLQNGQLGVPVSLLVGFQEWLFDQLTKCFPDEDVRNEVCLWE